MDVRKIQVEVGLIQILSCCVLLGHGLVKSSTEQRYSVVVYTLAAVDVGAILISLQGEWKFLMFIHRYLRNMFAGRNTQ